MSYTDIPPGVAIPDDFFTVIETPANHSPVKYEADNTSGQTFVDRFLSISTLYPVYHGFIPNTLGDDGDPRGVLLICPHPVSPGVVIRSRPVGVMYIKSEAGSGAKVIAVPHDKLSPEYNDVKEWEDLPLLLLAQIQHFFNNYNVPESCKGVKMGRWGSADEAREEIRKSVVTYAPK